MSVEEATIICFNFWSSTSTDLFSTFWFNALAFFSIAREAVEYENSPVADMQNTIKRVNDIHIRRFSELL